MNTEMSVLPDELWHQILATGIQTLTLTHRDLCSIAISGHQLCRISGDLSLWSSLLRRDFPSLSSSDLPPKSQYKDRFERDRERRRFEQRLAVLLAESDLADLTWRLGELKRNILEERGKMKAAAAEISNLENVRRSSVALNVWQPQVVRGRQKQIVEQCTVPIDSRLSALNMEIRICRQRITCCSKAYSDQKKKLKEGKEKLQAARYNPLQIYQPEMVANDCKKKRKR